MSVRTTDSSGRRINYIIRHDCHVSVRRVQREYDFSDLYYIFIGRRRFSAEDGWSGVGEGACGVKET